MSIKALVEMLRANAAVTALIGVGAACRAYQGKIAEGAALPAVYIERLDRTTYPAMGNDIALESARYSLTSWAANRTAAQALDAAVRGALQRKFGTAGGVVVQDIFVEATREEEADDLPTERYGETTDIVMHLQTAGVQAGDFDPGDFA